MGLISLCKCKLHMPTVTQADLNYTGSITIDSDLMVAAGLFEHEKVLVANRETGHRHETYIIKGGAGTGVICLNGPGARNFQVGDKCVIMAFELVPIEDAPYFKPHMVLVTDDNKVDRIL